MRKTNYSTGLRVLQHSMTTPTYKLQSAWFALITFMMVSISTYAQQPKWSLHNSEVDYIGSSSIPLPNGQSPDYTQNALWDDNGNLVFYEADGIVYDNQGNMLLQFERVNLSDPDAPRIPIKGFTEFLIFPVPEACNEFYGVISYSEHTLNGSGFDAVYWCRLEVDFTTTSTTVLPVNTSGEEIGIVPIQCESTDRTEGEPNTNEILNYFTHLEVSKLQSNNKRKVFCITPNCIVTIEADNQGLLFLDGLQYSRSGGIIDEFLPIVNLRTELEVFEIDQNVFNIVTPYYGDGSGSGINKFSVFTADYSTNNIQYSQQNYSILDTETTRLQKGIEFSEDGLTLYISHVKIQPIASGSPGFSVIPSGAHVIYYTRPNLNANFVYGGVLISGSANADFGYGMVEKGRDGSLYIIGDDRLAQLDDSNNPSSTLDLNYMVINNDISIADDYGMTNLPSAREFIHRQIYLMIDQVENENTDLWVNDSPLDQWPATISSPCSDFTTVTSQINGNWVWVPNSSSSAVFPDPCDPSSNPDISFDPNSRPGDGDPLLFSNTDQVNLEGPGMLYFFYGSGDCCYYETIRIDPLGDPSPSVSWVFVNDGSSVDLTLTSTTHPSIIGFNWTIEQWDGTQWVVVNTANNHGATWSLTGLNILTDYRISLTTIVDPQAPPCLVTNLQPIEINTGGRVGTFKGVAENTETDNL